MSQKDTIFYVYPRLSTFIKSDISELEKVYNIHENTYNWANKKLAPFFIIRQFFFFLFRIRKAKCVVVSFGGYWALAPAICGRLFKVPVYIILHGTDCASIPELNYGSLRKPIQKKAIQWSYINASELLPVSSSLITTSNTFNEKLPAKQGYLHHFPNLKTKNRVIPNGFDLTFWQTDMEKDASSFVSVFSDTQFYLKGGDLIIDIANHFPNYKFIVAGCEEPQISFPKNLIFKGKMKPEELRKEYGASKYYLQLSSYEGFGCALSEAMLCGCVPIVSNVNSMPEIIGSQGYVLKRKDTNELIELIQEISQDTSEFKPRERIKLSYPLQNRIDMLIELIDS